MFTAEECSAEQINSSACQHSQWQTNAHIVEAEDACSGNCAADGTAYSQDPIQASQADVWQQAGNAIEPVDRDRKEQQVRKRSQQAAKDERIEEFVMGAVWRGGRVSEDYCGALALLADCAPAIERANSGGKNCWKTKVSVSRP